MRMTDSYIDQLNGYTRPDYTITTDATSAPDKLFSLRQPATVIITGHCTQGDLKNMRDALDANASASRGAKIYLNLSQTDLTTVGDDTFSSFSDSLEGVSIPTSVETIGHNAFPYVKSAKIPNSWKLKTIGADAFSNLKAVVIPAATKYLWVYGGGYTEEITDILEPVTDGNIYWRKAQNKFMIEDNKFVRKFGLEGNICYDVCPKSAFNDETKIYTYA